jgi:tetratricopeptide (TPR) repeat protein
MKRQASLFLLTVLLLSGCVAQKSFHRAELEARRENWDKAVIEYSKAIAEDPGNTRYKIALERAKLKASAQHFQTGKRYAAAAQWDLAVAEFQQTLLLNSGNQHAQNELDHAMREIRRRGRRPLRDPDHEGEGAQEGPGPAAPLPQVEHHHGGHLQGPASHQESTRP